MFEQIVIIILIIIGVFLLSCIISAVYNLLCNEDDMEYYISKNVKFDDEITVILFNENDIITDKKEEKLKMKNFK